MISDEERASVAYRLFHQYYMISVPEIYCQSAAVIRETGTYTTGDKKLDKAAANHLRQRYCTVAGMCAFFDEGAPITLHRPEDAVQIYQMLMEHLANWNWIIHNFFDCDPPPAEDFILMDDFAKTIHPVAVMYGVGQEKESSFEKKFRTLRGRQGSFFDRMRSGGSDPTVKRQPPKHLSDHANAIVRRLWKADETEGGST